MCHARHARPAHREWPRAVDREQPSGPMRAGDADRERAAEALRTHAGAGRLDADELERRLETVLSATYLSELDAALADLPRLRGGEGPRTGRRERSAGEAGPPSPSRTTVLLGAVATLLVVTLLTGLWALWWLMWPIAMLTHGRGSCGRRPRATSRTASV